MGFKGGFKPPLKPLGFKPLLLKPLRGHSGSLTPALMCVFRKPAQPVCVVEYRSAGVGKLENSLPKDQLASTSQSGSLNCDRIRSSGSVRNCTVVRVASSASRRVAASASRDPRGFPTRLRGQLSKQVGRERGLDASASTGR